MQSDEGNSFMHQIYVHNTCSTYLIQIKLDSQTFYLSEFVNVFQIQSSKTYLLTAQIDGLVKYFSIISEQIFTFSIVFLSSFQDFQTNHEIPKQIGLRFNSISFSHFFPLSRPFYFLSLYCDQLSGKNRWLYFAIVAIFACG